MKRRTPPSWLTKAFHENALAYFSLFGPAAPGQPLRLYNGGPACWLKQFDPLDRPCSGDLEAVHLIGRQRIRNVLRGQLVAGFEGLGLFLEEDVDDLVELAEWDPRNGAGGCTGHHHRFDSHSTPELKVPGLMTPGPFRDFAVDWGLESDAERKFDGLDEVLAKHLERHRNREAAAVATERTVP